MAKQNTAKKNEAVVSQVQCSKCGDFVPADGTQQRNGKHYCVGGAGCSGKKATTKTETKGKATAKQATKVNKKLARDAQVIEILVTANPKKKGSMAHTQYNLYKNGMTVGEFYKACADCKSKLHPAGGDLKWNSEHGFIKLHKDQAAFDKATK